MRLTAKLREQAKDELLGILKKGGSRTIAELQGTPLFHGERTLSYRQIGNLVRELCEMGKITEIVWGTGYWARTLWVLKEAGNA